MKAKDLVKQEKTLDEIYKEIKTRSGNCEFKYFIPHFIFVSEKTKLKLIEDGYKVYIGQWDGIMNNCLIIEW